MLLLAGVALVIFGPEKLPKAAADAGRMVRRLREMARSAQADLTESAGVDISSITEDLRAVSDLHPKRLIGSAMSDIGQDAPRTPAAAASKPSLDPDAT